MTTPEQTECMALGTRTRASLLKGAELTKPTILALYNPEAPFKISPKVSSYGLEAVVLQCHGSD